MDPKVGIIIQARMGSTRLPGKVLKKVGNNTLLELLLMRLLNCEDCNTTIVATTTDPKDDIIEEVTEAFGAPVFRGSEEDVLSRYYECAKEYRLDIIVRITADCPLADPAVIDGLIRRFLELQKKGPMDYLSNTVRRSYPRGYDTEVFSFKALEKAHNEAREQYQHEHVTPYIHENSGIFEVVHATRESDDSDLRVTVDTQEDLDLIKAIHEVVKGDMESISMKDVIKLLRDRPDIRRLNQKVVQKGATDVG